MKAALVQQAAPLGTGTLQFTSSKFSSDVKAGIFFCTRATANDTITADSVIGIGFTDGTTEGWAGFGADDAVATADFNNRHLAVETVGRFDGTNTTSRIVGTVSGQSHPATGYQLNFTTVDDATLIKALLLGGSDVSADVILASFTNAASPETVAVSHSLGAAPTHILCLSACNPTGGSATRNRLSFGIYDVAGNSYAVHVVDASGTATAVTRSYLGTDAVAARQGTSASPDYKVTIANVDNDSFDMVLTGTTATDAMIFLALRIPNYEGSLSIVDIPTSGTVTLASSLTTRPILALNLPTRRTTTGTVTTGQSGGAFGLGIAVDTEGNLSAATSTQTQGPVTTTIEKSRISNTESITVFLDDGTVDVQGTVTFSATGATAGFTNFPAGACKMISWVLTPPAGIRLRSVGSAQSANATSIQPGAPAGQQAGDLMELVLGVQTSDETCMAAGLSGWLEAGHLDGSFRQLYKYVRVATGAGEAMPTIAPTGLVAGNTVVAQVAAYAPPTGSSFDISTVVADAALSTTSTATGAFTIPYAARSVAENNRLVSISWCFNGQSSAQALISGFTESQYASSSAGNDMSIGGQYRTQSSKADIASGTITITAGADQTDSSLVITYQTHPAGSADTWSSQQTGAPTGAVTIQSGSNRCFTIAVAWNSEVGASHSATLAVGGVEGTKSATLTQGTTNFSGIDIWTWDETAIGTMSGSTITTPSGSYPSTTSWAYNTITTVGSLTAPGYEAGTGTSLSLASPYGQTADKAVIVACSNAASGTYDPNPANGTGYTEVIDAQTSGGRPHFGIFTRSNSPAHDSTNSTITQSVTSDRFLAVHLGFNASAATVTVTDVSEIRNGGTFTITGTGLTQVATVELIDDQGHRVAQTKDSQNDTTIVCTFTRGTLRYTSGNTADLVITTALDVEVTVDLDILPQSGWSFANVIQLAASTDRVETSGSDLAVGDQVAAEVESGVRADGGIDIIDEAVTDFDVEVHDGTGWGTTGTITRADLTATAIVPNVVGLTLAAATTALHAANLDVFVAAEAYSFTILAGSVIGQHPPATTEVETGSDVSLITSLGVPGITLFRHRLQRTTRRARRALS